MRKIPKISAENIRKFLWKLVKLPRLRLVPGIVCLISFGVAVFVTISNMQKSLNVTSDFSDFETGRVADRDVIAEYTLSYIDEKATQERLEAQGHLVPAVFRFSANTGNSVENSWKEFCSFTDNLEDEGVSSASMQLAVQAEYPARFSAGTIASFLEDPDRGQYRYYGLKILTAIMEKGVFALKAVDLGGYNPDMVEVLVSLGDRTERERVNFNSIVTLDNVSEAITQAADPGEFSDEFNALAPDLLGPFVSENVFFSREDTLQRVAEAKDRVSPVINTIDKGKRIIRKGFVITGDEMLELQALKAALPRKDPRNIIGLVLLLALMYVLFIHLQAGRQVLGRELPPSESCLLFILVCLYLAGAGLIKNLIPPASNFPVSLFLPTAFPVMILAVFSGPYLALVMALAFPLCACLAGFFDISSCIFALISGAAASAVLRTAEKRMDLIRAGVAIAAANCLGIIVILLLHSVSVSEYPRMLFWAVLNGFVSGMLLIGALPPLEHALNAATAFRLIELSDLNAPILRKLFTTAPGTYSHSIMVATLAEQACQDIGANALLARVGAYYHDIGKMDNPNYFVENQTDYNRHDDIAPRLSATVIRSHVKVGVEKARSLGLPSDVIKIIAEHHGNSLITWFYNKATQQEEQVNSEDFSYPGSPPRSKESAVVMLADVTEAAVRTLTKPTAGKMEKFIQQLFDGKVEHGQLAQSDLSFRDLETIKNTFVKVLAAYYHSRIEYPKTGADAKEETG